MSSYPIVLEEEFKKYHFIWCPQAWAVLDVVGAKKAPPSMVRMSW